MDFLKELLQIQHSMTLHTVTQIILNNDYEKDCFIKKYDKKNYTAIKICNCKQYEPRVKILNLLSSLECDHNPSLNR